MNQFPSYPQIFLTNCLQRNMSFYLNERLIKKGRLLLFKRQHFFIQLSLLNDKNTQENFDIPIPFNMETYPEENLAYFDYRLNSLKVNNLPIQSKKVSSTFFDKIVEITIS